MGISFKSFSEGVFTTGWSSVHWYLYSYLAFLIVLPILRTIVKNISNQQFYLMFGIAFIFNTIIPLVQYFASIEININLNLDWIANINFIYPCLGYFLQYRIDINKMKKYIPFLWLANIITIGLTMYLTYYNRAKVGRCVEDESQIFYWLFVFVNCITLFVSIKYIFNTRKFNDIIVKIVISLFECTLGIYLLHLTFAYMPSIRNVYIFLINNMKLESMFACSVQCVLIFIISYLVTIVLKKIPMLRKIV